MEWIHMALTSPNKADVLNALKQTLNTTERLHITGSMVAKLLLRGISSRSVLQFTLMLLYNCASSDFAPFEENREALSVLLQILFPQTSDDKRTKLAFLAARIVRMYSSKPFFLHFATERNQTTAIVRSLMTASTTDRNLLTEYKRIWANLLRDQNSKDIFFNQLESGVSWQLVPLQISLVVVEECQITTPREFLLVQSLFVHYFHFQRLVNEENLFYGRMCAFLASFNGHIPLSTPFLNLLFDTDLDCRRSCKLIELIMKQVPAVELKVPTDVRQRFFQTLADKFAAALPECSDPESNNFAFVENALCILTASEFLKTSFFLSEKIWDLVDCCTLPEKLVSRLFFVATLNLSDLKKKSVAVSKLDRMCRAAASDERNWPLWVHVFHRFNGSPAFFSSELLHSYLVELLDKDLSKSAKAHSILVGMVRQLLTHRTTAEKILTGDDPRSVLAAIAPKLEECQDFVDSLYSQLRASFICVCAVAKFLLLLRDTRNALICVPPQDQGSLQLKGFGEIDSDLDDLGLARALCESSHVPADLLGLAALRYERCREPFSFLLSYYFARTVGRLEGFPQPSPVVEPNFEGFDVKFLVEGVEVNSNRSRLQWHSPFFVGLLSSNFAESSEPVVALDLSVEAFKLFLSVAHGDVQSRQELCDSIPNNDLMDLLFISNWLCADYIFKVAQFCASQRIVLVDCSLIGLVLAVDMPFLTDLQRLASGVALQNLHRFEAVLDLAELQSRASAGARKKEAREVHERSAYAQKVHGIKAKLYHKKRHSEKVQMKKTIKMHEEKEVKQKQKLPEGAVPAYLLDREGENKAKVLSNTIKQKRKEKAGKWSVPLPKVKGVAEDEIFKVIKTGKRKTKQWKRMITKATFVGEGFTRKPPKYERFIRPAALRMKRANVTHPELQTTFMLPIIGVKKNPQSPLYTQLGVLTKGTVIEVNVSELGLVTTGGKVIWGKYAQITNHPENDGCINAVLLV